MTMRRFDSFNEFEQYWNRVEEPRPKKTWFWLLSNWILPIWFAILSLFNYWAWQQMQAAKSQPPPSVIEEVLCEDKKKD